MEIFGREICFNYNVLSMKELAKICPGRNIKRFNELLDTDDTVAAYENAQGIIIALNRGYEMARHYNNPDYVPQPVSVDTLDCLDDDTLTTLLDEALAAIAKKQEIETAPETDAKKKEIPSN